MKLKRLSSFGSAAVLVASTFANIALVPLAHATAQTCDWTGATDNTFSNAGNWNNCGSGVPLAGDIIQFSTKPNADVTLTNDLGVTLGGVRMPTSSVSSGGNYTIDTISLAAGAAVSVVPGSICDALPIRVSFNTINAAGDLTLSRYSISSTTPAVTVAGNLTTDSGYLAFAQGSSVSGGVTISTPIPYTSATGCPGGQGGGYQPGSSITGFTINGLTVEKGANVNLASAAFPITLGGGTGSDVPIVNFFSDSDSNNNPIPVTYTISGPITLVDDAQFYLYKGVTVNVTGALSGAGKALTKNVYSEGTLNVNPSLNDTSTQTGTLENPVKTTTISDNQASFVSVVDNETTVLDGTRSSVYVYPGGVLKGTGTVTSGINVAQGGTLAPGHSPGCINSGDLTLNGTYQVEIGGTTACTGYDQTKVTGTVDITGATLDGVLYNGFVPTVGQSYTIIDNDGTADAVTGTFQGIAEGGSYTNQGVTYSVTYKGGDGNDVVLTVTAIDASQLPKTPNTGFRLLTTSPVVTLLATTVAAGAILFARKRLATAPTKK